MMSGVKCLKEAFFTFTVYLCVILQTPTLPTTPRCLIPVSVCASPEAKLNPNCPWCVLRGSKTGRPLSPCVPSKPISYVYLLWHVTNGVYFKPKQNAHRPLAPRGVHAEFAHLTEIKGVSFDVCLSVARDNIYLLLRYVTIASWPLCLSIQVTLAKRGRKLYKRTCLCVRLYLPLYGVVYGWCFACNHLWFSLTAELINSCGIFIPSWREFLRL